MREIEAQRRELQILLSGKDQIIEDIAKELHTAQMDLSDLQRGDTVRLEVIAALKAEKEKIVKLLAAEKLEKKKALKEVEEADSVATESAEAIASLTEQHEGIQKRY